MTAKWNLMNLIFMPNMDLNQVNFLCEKGFKPPKESYLANSYFWMRREGRIQRWERERKKERGVGRERGRGGGSRVGGKGCNPLEQSSTATIWN